MFLPLQKRRAKKRNSKTQKTSATSGLLTVLRPSAKRKKNNSKERFVSKERVVRVLPIISPCLRTLLPRSEEHTSELQSLMRISYAVFCLKKKNTINIITKIYYNYNKIQQHI